MVNFVNWFGFDRAANKDGGYGFPLDGGK